MVNLNEGERGLVLLQLNVPDFVDFSLGGVDKGWVGGAEAGGGQEE